MDDSIEKPCLQIRLSLIRIHFYFFLPSITTFVKRFSLTWVGRLPCGARTLLIDRMSTECVRCGLVVRICGSHPQGPGSIPGNGIVFTFSTIELEKHNEICVLDVSIEKSCFQKHCFTFISTFLPSKTTFDEMFSWTWLSAAAMRGPNTTHRHNVVRMCPLWSSG